MNCKACNKPIEGEGRFCSEKCARSFVLTLGKINRTTQNMKKKEKNTIQSSFGWESVIKRTGKFFISNLSLDLIRDSVSKNAEFETLLSSNNLMIVRLNDELSVIKKNIL